jgi:SAM-dependent methyltransferase
MPTPQDPDFDTLIEEAERRPLIGWDVSYDGRIATAAPWDFGAIVDSHARVSPDLLDLGTGGGEWLGARPFLPSRTVATEGWPPNVPIARARLASLGIEVFAVEGAPDNVAQTADPAGGALPFPSDAFHLIISRHESYVASEVRRVLAPGGVFLTQQVSSGAADDFYRLFGEVPPIVPTAWDLAFAGRQLRDADFIIGEQGEGFETMRFADVGALAWYLKNVPFVYPEFSIATARATLRRLHEDNRRGRLLHVRQPLFRLAARKP